MIFILFCWFILGIYSLECPSHPLSEIQLLDLEPDCFAIKYDSKIHDGHNLERVIDKKLKAFKKIHQYLKMRRIQAIETTPVIKWAQNQQQIYINLKLSHRQDSPPCSDVRFDKFSVTNVDNITGRFQIQERLFSDNNRSGFNFLGECFFTDQKFLFRINMTFNASISTLSIERQGFGQYTIIGSKKQKQIWIDPFNDVLRAAIWPELRSKFSAAMDNYFKLRQDRSQLSSQQKKKKKRKRRPASTRDDSQMKQKQKKQNQQEIEKDSSLQIETEQIKHQEKAMDNSADL